jgi:glucose-1-phosphate cytidylyltransferase
VILAGGYGTRLSEETDMIPKPMVKIGNIPMLRHIINYYSKFGHKDFVIAAGYKAELIDKYFMEELFSIKNNNLNVKVIDTGVEVSTGGRIKYLEDQLDEEFMLTYGDGLSNVNLNDLMKHHKKYNKIATVTAVRPPARFGAISISNGIVTRFAEKDTQDTSWINGGFFCLNKKICSFIKDMITPFENGPLNEVVSIEQLSAFEHHGWWQPMDTLRDKRSLQSLWEKGEAPWLKV